MHPRLIDKVLHTEPANLVACWASCGESGAVLYDFARFGPYNGIIAGGVARSETIIPGYTFDGVDGRIDIYSATTPSKLLNGGFEQAGAGGADIWDEWVETAGDGALANEGVIVHQGADACKMTAGATANTMVTNPPFVVVPGKTYRIRLWTYGDGVNAGRYKVWDNTNAAYIIPMTSTGVTGAAYEMIAVEFTAPEDCVLATLDLCCPAANGGICYFDAVEVHEKRHAFDGLEGSVLVLHKIPAAAWTDGIKRFAFQMQVDNSNLVQFRKAIANNTFEMEWQGNSSQLIFTQDPFSDTDVMRHGLGWSVAGDVVTGYYNGTPLGNSNMVFDFFGDVSAIAACIGASSNAGDNPYLGDIYLVALWSKKLTDTQFGYLGLP